MVAMLSRHKRIGERKKKDLQYARIHNANRSVSTIESTVT